MTARRFRLRLLASAQRNLVAIYADSLVRFGGAARERYRRLIETALEDIRDDPARNGVRVYRDIYRLYPIRLSRTRAAQKGRVGNPRQILAFRVDGEVVIIARVLHEAMDIETQLAPGNGKN